MAESRQRQLLGREGAARPLVASSTSTRNPDRAR